MTNPTAPVLADHWCPICEAKVIPEWQAIAGYRLGPLHTHDGSLHGVQPPNGHTQGGPVITVLREVVVRRAGRFHTIEPEETPSA